MSNGICNCGSTDKYKFHFITVGMEWSAAVEKSRFQKIDKILSNLYAISGDGVICGWDMSVSEDAVIISSGMGVIDGFFSKSDFSISVALVRGIKNNVFAKIKGEVHYPRVDDLMAFIESLSEPKLPHGKRSNDIEYLNEVNIYRKTIRDFLESYDWKSNEDNLFNVVEFFVSSSDFIPNAVFLGSITHNGNEFNIDLENREAVFRLIKRKKNVVDNLVCRHNHLISKVDLSSDVTGVVAGESIAHIDADSFISGKFKKAIVPTISHIGIVGSGSFTHEEIEDRISILSTGMPIGFMDICRYNSSVARSMLMGLPVSRIGDSSFRSVLPVYEKDVSDIDVHSRSMSSIASIVFNVDYNDVPKDIALDRIRKKLVADLSGYDGTTFDLMYRSKRPMESSLTVENLCQSTFVNIDLMNPNKTTYFFQMKDDVIVNVSDEIFVDGFTVKVLSKKGSLIVCEGGNFDIFSKYILYAGDYFEFIAQRKLMARDEFVLKFGFCGLTRGNRYSVSFIRMDGVDILFPNKSFWVGAEPVGENSFVANGEEVLNILNEPVKFSGISLELDFHSSSDENISFFIENGSGSRVYWDVRVFNEGVCDPFMWVGKSLSLVNSYVCDFNVGGMDVEFNVVGERDGVLLEPKCKVVGHKAKSELACDYPRLNIVPFNVGPMTYSFGSFHSIRSSVFGQISGEVNVKFVSPISIYSKFSSGVNLSKRLDILAKDNLISVHVLDDVCGDISVETKIYDKFSLIFGRDVRSIVAHSSSARINDILIGERLDLYMGVDEILENISDGVSDWSILVDEEIKGSDGTILESISVDDGVLAFFKVVNMYGYYFVKTDVVVVSEDVNLSCGVVAESDNNCAHYVENKTVYYPFNNILIDFLSMDLDSVISKISEISDCSVVVGSDLDDIYRISSDRLNKRISETGGDPFSYVFSNEICLDDDNVLLYNE